MTAEERLDDPDVVGPHASRAALAALLHAEHGDPFALLGAHADARGRWWLRALLPGAEAVEAIAVDDGAVLATLSRVHEAGLFIARVPRRRRLPDYRWRVRWAGGVTTVLDDPYRYGPLLGELDLWLLAEGTHADPAARLGAQVCRHGDADGTQFAVWAPGARRVAVVGDWNDWDERRHPMRLRREAGVWELFVPDVAPGARYKFALLEADGRRGPWRADPYARQCELRPATASVVAADLPAAPAQVGPPAHKAAPMAIYEVHVGSWARVVEEGDRWLDWDELGERLVPYAQDMGFTHLELLPVTEHPLDASWGYQPIGLYAPSARFGPPEAFQRFVQRCHLAGLGLILDWVPGHFPADAHGLARFDGTHLYEHADPREGLHPDWQTLIYNFGRHEVLQFLVGNARYWIARYGVDGLRVDAVASMLYRDYSRAAGEWLPNAAGGRENLEAVAFLRRLNTELGASAPQAMTIAEESTAWPGVTAPADAGGLGFHYKWNMGWMNDTLRYMARDPVHRQHHHNELTFGLLYAFDEQFILPLSHDEVVHGKGSLLGRMPGERWHRFANLRMYFGFMYAHPGKKLLFMGGEFAQVREWDHASSLDWHLLDDPAHRGVQNLVRDLNHLYRRLPALHAQDCERAGFAWITHDDHKQSVLAFTRFGRQADERVIAVSNFTPMARHGYRIGVPAEGAWLECFNSDSAYYGGGNLGNGGSRLLPEAIAAHGMPASLALTLPPLATLYLQWTA